MDGMLDQSEGGSDLEVPHAAFPGKRLGPLILALGAGHRVGFVRFQVVVLQRGLMPVVLNRACQSIPELALIRLQILGGRADGAHVVIPCPPRHLAALEGSLGIPVGDGIGLFRTIGAMKTYRARFVLLQIVGIGEQNQGVLREVGGAVLGRRKDKGNADLGEAAADEIPLVLVALEDEFTGREGSLAAVIDVQARRKHGIVLEFLVQEQKRGFQIRLLQVDPRRAAELQGHRDGFEDEPVERERPIGALATHLRDDAIDLSLGATGGENRDLSRDSLQLLELDEGIARHDLDFKPEALIDGLIPGDPVGQQLTVRYPGIGGGVKLYQAGGLAKVALQ